VPSAAKLGTRNSELRTNMRVGTLTVTIHLAEGSSLKDKRQEIKSLLEKTRRKFNVSIAEVDDLDIWRRATLGVAVVSNDAKFCNQVLDKVLDYFESQPELDVGEVEMEVD
jgi:uncharacterized protein YlxP (DUF503 family)